MPTPPTETSAPELVAINATPSAVVSTRTTGLSTPRPRTFSRKVSSMLAELTPGAWMFLDFGLAAACLTLAYSLAASRGQLEPTALPAILAVPVFGVLFFLSAHILGLHDKSIRRGEVSLMVKSVLAVIMAIGLSYYGTMQLFLFRIPVRPLAMGGFALLSLILLSRAWIWRISYLHAQRLCVFGSEEATGKARRFLLSQPTPVEITTILTQDVHADSQEFLHWCKKQYMDEIICVEEPPDSLTPLLLACMEKGIRVTNYPEHLERNYHCVSLEHLTNRWFFGTDMEALHPQYVALKRASDIFLATLGLLAASPFLLLAMLAIKLESRGPIFYSQIRTGLRGEPFPILKLRSMRTDAEKNGAQWAKKGDARVTRIGKFLRLSRLDEVPQFINILRGDMSFIGPRPERPEFVEKLAAEIPFYRQRHLLKPGLTGWAQIQADYGGTVEGVKQKLQYDLYYVKHASLALDLHICIRTLGAMMKGAR